MCCGLRDFFLGQHCREASVSPAQTSSCCRASSLGEDHTGPLKTRVGNEEPDRQGGLSRRCSRHLAPLLLQMLFF